MIAVANPIITFPNPVILRQDETNMFKICSLQHLKCVLGSSLQGPVLWLCEVETEHSEHSDHNDHSDHRGALFSTRNMPRINVAAPPFRHVQDVPRCHNTMPRLQRCPSRQAKNIRSAMICWCSTRFANATIPASQRSTSCFSTLRASPGNPLRLWTHKKKVKKNDRALWKDACDTSRRPHLILKHCHGIPRLLIVVLHAPDLLVNVHILPNNHPKM